MFSKAFPRHSRSTIGLVPRRQQHVRKDLDLLGIHRYLVLCGPPSTKFSCWTETTKLNKDKRIEKLQLKNLCVACWEAMATCCTFCRQWHWRKFKFVLFLEASPGSFTGLTSLAKHIFLSLHSVMCKRRANLKHLFKYVNHGIPGAWANWRGC